jgi:hypothetical protein
MNVVLTVPSRRSRWLRTWLPAMGAFSAAAIGAMTWVAVLGFPGWQWTDVTIGAFAVITVSLNMWMAWESVR